MHTSRLTHSLITLGVLLVSFAVLTPVAQYGIDAYANSAENVKANRVYVLSTRREGGGKSSTRYWVKFRMEDGSVKHMNFTSGPGAEAGSYWIVYTYNWKRDPATLHYWMRDPTKFPSYLPYLLGGVGAGFLAFTYVTMRPRPRQRSRYTDPGRRELLLLADTDHTARLDLATAG